MTRNEAAMLNTYMFSNMAPQYANFNRIIWRRLEGFVRDWAKLRGEIFVVTGAVFDRDNDKQRDADANADYMDPTDRVAVPTHFYKIIFHERPNGYVDTMTFMLPHNNEKHTGKNGVAYINSALTSIDEIEGMTGLDFLPGMAMENAGKERAVENFVADKMWPRK